MPEDWDVPYSLTGWTRKGERSPGEFKQVSTCIYAAIIQNICLFVLASSVVTHQLLLPLCLSKTAWVVPSPKTEKPKAPSLRLLEQKQSTSPFEAEGKPLHFNGFDHQKW